MHLICGIGLTMCSNGHRWDGIKRELDKCMKDMSISSHDSYASESLLPGNNNEGVLNSSVVEHMICM